MFNMMFSISENSCKSLKSIVSMNIELVPSITDMTLVPFRNINCKKQVF